MHITGITIDKQLEGFFRLTDTGILPVSVNFHQRMQMHLDRIAMGDRCFDMLTHRMRDPKAHIENLMLEQKIVLRESVKLDAANAEAEGLTLNAQ